MEVIIMNKTDRKRMDLGD